MIRKFAAALLTASLGTQAVAAETKCVTSEEAAAAAVAIAPSLVDAVASKCSASLPAGAFLNSGAKEMSERFKSAVPDRDAVLGRVVENFAGKDMPPGAKGPAMTALMEAMVVGQVAGAIDAGDCASYDSLLQAAAPLPPENFGTIVRAILDIVVRHSDAKDKKMPFCGGPINVRLPAK